MDNIGWTYELILDTTPTTTTPLLQPPQQQSHHNHTTLTPTTQPVTTITQLSPPQHSLTTTTPLSPPPPHHLYTTARAKVPSLTTRCDRCLQQRSQQISPLLCMQSLLSSHKLLQKICSTYGGPVFRRVLASPK